MLYLVHVSKACLISAYAGADPGFMKEGVFSQHELLWGVREQAT